jgi:hypothetical protein
MRTDVRTRVRDHIAGLPVPEPDLDAVITAARRPEHRRGAGTGRPDRSGRPWLAPLLAAAAVVAVVFSIAVAPALPLGRGERPGAGPASLPDQIAGYSYLTRSVSFDPPGRAIALYQHGWGVELFDFPQALVLGADADIYRRVDVAEGASALVDQGDPAPMRLSPDGTRVAVGTSGTGGELGLVDLSTGAVTRLSARPGSSVRPLAFSPDGRIVVAAENTSPMSGSPATAVLARFDLTTGAVTRFPALTRITAAAFSPDGRELAVQSGGALLVVDPGTGAIRRNLVTASLPLVSEAAWSPAGDLIAVGPDEPPRIAFVDATGAGRAVPAPVEGVGRPLGWTDDRTLIVQDGRNVVELTVNDGGTRVISEVDTGPGSNYRVGDMYLATGLVDGLVVRAAGSPDRGIWPTWAIVTATVATGLVATLFVIVIRLLGRPRRGTRAGPRPG